MNETTQPAVAGPVEPKFRPRAAFEAWISAPPFEREVERFGDNSAWPGNYRELDVDLAWQAWAAATALARQRCVQIVEAYKVPVGNSAAGEMAAEWTMDALREIRDAIRGA
jgi:hypothetical protein